MHGLPELLRRFQPHGVAGAFEQGAAPPFQDRLHQVLQMPDVRARLEGAGNTVRLETPEQFRQTVHANRLKWAEVVRAASITLD